MELWEISIMAWCIAPVPFIALPLLKLGWWVEDKFNLHGDY